MEFSKNFAVQSFYCGPKAYTDCYYINFGQFTISLHEPLRNKTRKCLKWVKLSYFILVFESVKVFSLTFLFFLVLENCFTIIFMTDETAIT